MSNRVKMNAAALTTSIEQVGERAVRGISQVMQDEGRIMQRLAKDYAPVDYGFLRDAISLDVDRGGINRRTRVRVYVDMDADAGGNKRVGDYALFIHEGLAPYGSGAAGVARNGGGGKFMERAVDERAPELLASVQALVKRALS